MSTILRDQIMDELMDCPHTITDLADALGSYHERIRRELVRLEYEGLVLVSGTVKTGGPPIEIYDMARTRKAA